jgi:hypothetical protein
VSNDVKLHTSFFLLHLLSNDIKLHTSFQTKLNPIENCVIALFLLAIVLPALALGDLKTLLALFLKQKRVRKFTWLDPIQCEKNTCTIFNRVHIFSQEAKIRF